MSCVSPLKAYWRDVNRSAITFDPVHSATKVPFMIPCGRCVGCRLERARQWGMRCLHEKKLWKSSYFVTLTYSDEFLPLGGSLSLRDVQLFMKRLRKAKNSTTNNPVRFFLAGEYGDENYRPHYHALLFNVKFEDLRPWTKNARGEQLYISGELSELWSVDGSAMGHVSLGEVTFDSAVYCAKYAMKKLNITDKSTPEAKEAYERKYVVYDIDGVVHERRPEFAVMSRRPGIGAGYYEKYGKEVREHDNVIIDGRPVRPPRFYDLKSEVSDPDLHARNKAERKKAGVRAKPDNTPQRLRVKARLMELAAEKKERKL